MIRNAIHLSLFLFAAGVSLLGASERIVDPTGSAMRSAAEQDLTDITTYAVIDINESHSYDIKVGNEGHVLAHVNNSSENYFLRYRWGNSETFESSGGSQKGYWLNAMNNHGDIAGRYHSKDVESVGIQTDCFSSIYQFRYSKPLVIKADGSRTELDVPEVEGLVAPEVGLHGVVSISDDGVLIVRSLDVKILYEETGVPSNGTIATRYFKYADETYDEITDIEITGEDYHYNSHCGHDHPESFKYKGFASNSISMSNGGVLMGVGYRAYDWMSRFSTSGWTRLYFVGSASSEVTYEPLEINASDLILGREDGAYSLYEGSEIFGLPTGIAFHDLTSPEENERLILVSEEELAIQKTDPQTGELLPLSLGEDAYDVHSIEELIHQPGEDGTATSNAQWSDLTIVDISDNGLFLGGGAVNAQTGNRHALLLVRMGLESRDRAIRGIIPGRLDDVGVVDVSISNLTTGETIGTCTDVFQQNGTQTFVYASEDDIFSDDEIDQFANGGSGPQIEQDIVFIRLPNGDIEFFTTASELGTVEVALTIDGGTPAVLRHELTADNEFGKLIDAVAGFVSGEPSPAVGGYPAPVPDPGDPGGGIVTVAAMTPFATMGDGPLAGKRNLVTKVLIPWVKRNLLLNATCGYGFVFGAWDGLKGDAEGIVEVVKLFSNPFRSASELYHGFKALKDVTFGDFINIVNNTYDAFLDNQIDRTPWVYSGTPLEDATTITYYMVGYGGGFIVEQVVITVGTAGLGKIGTAGKVGRIIASILKKARAAGSIVIDGGVGVSRKFKSGYNKIVSQFVSSTENGREIRMAAEKFSREADLNGKPVGNHMHEGIDRINQNHPNADFAYSDIIVDEMFDTRHAALGDAADLKVGAYTTQIARMLTILGDHVSPDAARGFVRAYKRLIVSDTPSQITDRFNDLVYLYKATDTDAGKQALARSLEAYKVATDSTPNAKFWVRNFDQVSADMYHHMPETGFARIEIRDGNAYLKAYNGDRGWYVTPDRFDTQQSAASMLQLPDIENGRYRCKFGTHEVSDNLKMPSDNVNQAGNPFEPLTRYFPENGEGGGRQMLLESKEVVLDEIYDTVEGRYLTQTEIQQLIGQ